MNMQSVALSLNNALYRNRSAAWRYLKAGPGHLFMYVFGRFRLVRWIMVLVYQRSLPKTEIVPGTSVVHDVDIDQAVRAIAKDGYFSGLQLRADVLDELRGFASDATCFAEEDFGSPFHLAEKAEAEQRYGRKIKVGRFDDILLTLPLARKLASDPTLLAIVRGYLRTEPALLGARMWWSFASPASTAQQRSLGQGFHYDIDGYRALAFFFYLTDVTRSSGAHICVRGSHAEKPLKTLVSLHKSRTDEEIANWYGTERQVAMCGPAGVGFAEDIFCFHKGAHPESGDRLVLQLRYGLRNYDGKDAALSPKRGKT